MDIPATSDNIPGTLVLRDSSGTISTKGIELPSGGFITGDFTGSPISSRTFFRAKDTVDGGTSVGAIPNGSSTYSNFAVFGSTDIDNSPVGIFVTDGSYVGISATSLGTGPFLPFRIDTANQERLRVKTTGQVRFVPLASDPAGAEAGDVYYNSGSNKLKVYNGSSWIDLH